METKKSPTLFVCGNCEASIVDDVGVEAEDQGEPEHHDWAHHVDHSA